MIGKQILADAYAKNPNKNHPRILLNAEDFARIRENKNDPVVAATIEKLREAAKIISEKDLAGSNLHWRACYDE